jgi:ribonuclease I
MSSNLKPIEYFAEMIMARDNISVQEWNDLIDKANLIFQNEIRHAFNEGKITILNKLEKSSIEHYNQRYENI